MAVGSSQQLCSPTLSLADSIRARGSAMIRLALALPGLRRLSLCNAAFSAADVSSLASLSQLEELSLTGAMECGGPAFTALTPAPSTYTPPHSASPAEVAASVHQRLLAGLPRLRKLQLPMAVSPFTQCRRGFGEGSDVFCCSDEEEDDLPLSLHLPLMPHFGAQQPTQLHRAAHSDTPAPPPPSGFSPGGIWFQNGSRHGTPSISSTGITASSTSSLGSWQPDGWAGVADRRSWQMASQLPGNSASWRSLASSGFLGDVTMCDVGEGCEAVEAMDVAEPACTDPDWGPHGEPSRRVLSAVGPREIGGVAVAVRPAASRLRDGDDGAACPGPPSAARWSFPSLLEELTIPLCGLNAQLFRAVCAAYGGEAREGRGLRVLHVQCAPGYTVWEGSFLNSESDFQSLSRVSSLETLHLSLELGGWGSGALQGNGLRSCLLHLRALRQLQDLRISETQQPICFSTRKPRPGPAPSLLALLVDPDDDTPAQPAPAIRLPALPRLGELSPPTSFLPSAAARLFTMPTFSTASSRFMASLPAAPACPSSASLTALLAHWPQMRSLVVCGQRVLRSRQGGRDRLVLPGSLQELVELQQEGAEMHQGKTPLEGPANLASFSPRSPVGVCSAAQ